jgi:hypothetical protein
LRRSVSLLWRIDSAGSAFAFHAANTAAALTSGGTASAVAATTAEVQGTARGIAFIQQVVF